MNEWMTNAIAFRTFFIVHSLRNLKFLEANRGQEKIAQRKKLDERLFVLESQ